MDGRAKPTRANDNENHMNNIYQALDALFTRYLNLAKLELNSLPVVHFDPPWPSPCVVTAPSDSTQQEDQTAHAWKPISREQYNLFDNLETAFEDSFPEELKWFYGSFWSNGICVEYDTLPFNLIQIWNEEDEEQLKENMLGHVFAKNKNKQPISYFIGCTDGNDVIALDKETGAIVLEKPGYKAHQKLADSLEKLLIGLTPKLDSY